jgi:hypothetical protein
MPSLQVMRLAAWPLAMLLAASVFWRSGAAILGGCALVLALSRLRLLANRRRAEQSGWQIVRATSTSIGQALKLKQRETCYWVRQS